MQFNPGLWCTRMLLDLPLEIELLDLAPHQISARKSKFKMIDTGKLLDVNVASVLFQLYSGEAYELLWHVRQRYRQTDHISCC